MAGDLGILSTTYYDFFTSILNHICLLGHKCPAVNELKKNNNNFTSSSYPVHSTQVSRLGSDLFTKLNLTANLERKE